MYNVLERGVPASLGGYSKIEFFLLRKFTVGDATLSLYEYENNVIRPFGEERVHFALNCMAIGCPKLPRAPFTAEPLEDQLEREARAFLNEERNLRIEPASRTVYLSEILDFYAEDFLMHARSLVTYVNRYRASPIPEEYEIRFIPYDWRVNAKPLKP